MATTLATYETQVRDLLHDPNAQNWTNTQIDAYVNEARRQLVADSGCLRSLQQSYCTMGQEAYTYGQVCGASIVAGGANYTAPTVSFSGGGGSGVAATLATTGGAVTAISFTNFGSGYASAPTITITDGTGTGASIVAGVCNVNTLDILSVSVTSGSKCQLDWRPFSAFSAWFRGLPGQLGRPGCWAAYGDTQFYLALIPDQTYAMELDTVVSPNDYAVGDYVTVEVIPVSMQAPIKYYAAALAEYWDQKFGQQEIFMQEYRKQLQIACNQVFTRRIPSPYSGTGP